MRACQVIGEMERLEREMERAAAWNAHRRQLDATKLRQTDISARTCLQWILEAEESKGSDLAYCRRLRHELEQMEG